MLDITAKINEYISDKGQERIIIEYVCSTPEYVEECIMNLIYDENGIITTYDDIAQDLGKNEKLKDIYDLIVDKMDNNVVTRIFDEMSRINKAHEFIYSQLEDHLIAIEAKTLDCFIKNCDFESLKEYEFFKISIKNEMVKVINDRSFKVKGIKVF